MAKSKTKKYDGIGSPGRRDDFKKYYVCRFVLKKIPPQDKTIP